VINALIKWVINALNTGKGGEVRMSKDKSPKKEVKKPKKNK